MRGWQSRLLSDIQTTFPKLAHLFFVGAACITCGRKVWAESHRGLHGQRYSGLTIFDFIAPIQYEAEVRSIIHADFRMSLALTVY